MRKISDIIYKRTWAEINMSAARKNFKILQGLIDKKTTRTVCVVKADGYGHGDVALSKLYEKMGVDFFAVSNLDEAVRLRDSGISGDILILGWTSPEYANELISHDIIQTIVSKEHADELALHIEKDSKLRVHIKLDTGMGRIGFSTDNLETLLEEVLDVYATGKFNLEGIFSHFSVADETDEQSLEFTKKQAEIFAEAVSTIEKSGLHFTEKHILNSAGTFLHYDNYNTLARIGILLYGLKPDINLTIPSGIKPIMELKSVVSHIKTVKKGTSISYGRTFIAETDMKIATIQVGYADGYPRLLSGKNTVKIRDSYASGIGRICMDQMMVDVTSIPNVSVGDEVLLFGADEKLTADKLAGIYGSIGYEIVCGINKRVPRIYLENEV